MIGVLILGKRLVKCGGGQRSSAKGNGILSVKRRCCPLLVHPLPTSSSIANPLKVAFFNIPISHLLRLSITFQTPAPINQVSASSSSLSQRMLYNPRHSIIRVKGLCDCLRELAPSHSHSFLSSQCQLQRFDVRITHVNTASVPKRPAMAT